MKFLKKWAFLPMAVLMALSVAAFAACSGDGENTDYDDDTEQGDDGDTTTPGETAYTFEAEYTYLIGLEGLGPSGSPASLGLIGESATASNGFYVGSIGEKSPITFKITSSEAVTVTLKGAFGSNALGTCDWDPETFVITVNGTPMNYTAFTTEKGIDDVQNFKTKTLGTINLVAGENTIVFSAGENTYLNNLASAPSIDCIKISTTATLTMESYESNLE